MLDIMNATLERNNNSFNKSTKKTEKSDFLSIFDTTESDVREDELLEAMNTIQNIRIEQYNYEDSKIVIENEGLNIISDKSVRISNLNDLEIINKLMEFENSVFNIENVELNITVKDKSLNMDKASNHLNLIIQNEENKEDIFKIINTEEVNLEKEIPSIKSQTLNFKNNYKIASQDNREIELLKEIADDGNIFITQSMNKNTLNINSNELDIENKPVIIRQEYLSKDIVKVITYLKNNDVQNLKLNITPKNLGEITINLTKSSTDTKILITISEQESFNLINKNLKEITQHLENTNIKVNQIVVEVKTDNQSFFGDSLSQQFNDRRDQNQSSKQNKNEKEVLEQEKTIVNKDENISILA